MSTRREIVSFRDFSGGDVGRQRPDPNDLKKYRTLNTWVYPNGALGPRPPWIQHAIEGLPSGKDIPLTFNAWITPSAERMVWSFGDGDVYSAAELSGSWSASEAATQSFNPNGTYTDSVVNGGHVYILQNQDSDSGVLIDEDGNGTLEGDFPGGVAIEQYSEQTVVLVNPDYASGPTTPFIWFSDPRDPTTWPVENTVFIGNGGLGHNLYVQKDQLVIPKTLIGEVWVFTGVLGANEFLRRMDTGVAPMPPQQAEGYVTSSSLLMYTTGRTVSMFTGAQLVQEERPDLPIVTGYDTDPQYDHAGRVIGLDNDESFLITGTFDGSSDDNDKIVWMQSYSPQSGWHRHIVPITWKATISGNTFSKNDAQGFKTHPMGSSGVIYGCTGEDANDENELFRVYSFFSRQEAPYLPVGKVLSGVQPGSFSGVGTTFTTVADGDSGLPVEAEWHSAEVWGEDNTQSLVRTVVVDYSYDTDSRICTNLDNGTVVNQFDISVQTLQPEQGTALRESSVVQFRPQADGAGTAIDGGTMRRGRATFQFGDQGTAGGFRLHIDNWRGIMIHEITVHYDVEPARV